jgi:hypothetical protein
MKQLNFIQNNTTQYVTIKRKNRNPFDLFKDCISTQPTLANRDSYDLKPGESVYLSKGDYDYMCYITWSGWKTASDNIDTC